MFDPKILVSEMENSLEYLSSRLKESKDRISELEDEVQTKTEYDKNP